MAEGWRGGKCVELRSIKDRGPSAKREMGLTKASVCIRIVGSGMSLPPLPTGDVTFCEDMAVERVPG